MTDTLICDSNNDAPNKQSSSILTLFPVSKLVKTDSSDSSTRKLRILMNKASDNNFQKLLDDLLETQTLDEKLLHEFVKLLFDRACNKSSPELFVDVLAYFSHRLRQLDLEQFRVLKKEIKSRVEISGLYQQNAGWAKFVACLYKERVVSQKTISKLLTPSRSETVTEKFLENFCVLLEIVSPHLSCCFESQLEDSFEFLSQANISGLSKKIQYLVVGTLEQKPKLMTRGITYVPRFTGLFAGHPCKKVSFSEFQEFIPVLSNKAKRILKHTLSEESKIALRGCVSEYVKGKKDLTLFKALFESCKNQERQLVYQVFKHALIQFGREQELCVVCELVSEAVEKFLSKGVVETGVAYTVEAIEDIKLDTPMADGYLRVMIENLKEKGIIENSQYLIDHLMRPEDGKFTEGADNTY